MSIVIEHLNYVYMQGGPYETRALDDVSLTIHDGEFIGLIGHTGSGKSTLVQHLNGLILPTSGKITVDGMDLAEKGTDRRAIRRRVGLVFQYPENQLFEETVAKDIAFGPKNLGLDEAEIDRRVRTLPTEIAAEDPVCQPADRKHPRSRTGRQGSPQAAPRRLQKLRLAGQQIDADGQRNKGIRCRPRRTGCSLGR